MSSNIEAAIGGCAASDWEMARARAIALSTSPMIDPQAAPSSDDTAALVALAARGDVGAFEQLYQRTAGRVYAVCIRMTGDPQRARELTHDSFVRAWERLSTFRGEAAFETWMHRLAVNVVLTVRRGERRREAHLVHTDDDNASESEATLGRPGPDVESRIDLERAIAALPPRAREVFVLHDVEGYKHDEIADRLDLQSSSVRAQLHRARRLIMGMLNR
jgi:RNA polymerase sigma-70 factor (ECF subfamily)